MTGRRRRRRRRKLLDDLKERIGYSHLKEEALDRTMWRAGHTSKAPNLVNPLNRPVLSNWVSVNK